MTAVLEKELTPDVGSMTPRKFTPPLPHHCTGPKPDSRGELLECPCNCGLNPETSWGFDCNRFADKVLGWKLLPYQRWLNIHSLEKNDIDGGFRFKILIVLISRQQGKTYWLKQLGLWRLFVNSWGRADSQGPGAKMALISSTNLQYAEGVLKEVVDTIRDNSGLSKELINHRVCLDVDTPLLTTAGWKTMENITVGDQVYHPDGHPTEVMAVHPIYDDHVCYELTTTDGRTIVCDAGHRWAVQDTFRWFGQWHYKDKRGSEPRWEVLTTDQLIERGIGNQGGRAGRSRYRFRLPAQKAIISKPIDLPIDPYLLGLWLGDGYKRQAEIIMGPQDRDELVTNIEATGATIVSMRPGKDDPSHPTRSATMTVRFNIGAAAKDGFMAQVHKLGICTSATHPRPRSNNKTGYSGIWWHKKCQKWAAHVTHRGQKVYLGLFDDPETAHEAVCVKRAALVGTATDKHIPDIYLTAGTEQRLALLQGLMDSDGTINAKRGQAEFGNTNKDLADGVVYLCRSLGLRPTLITKQPGGVRATFYRVCFTPDVSQPNPFRLTRKAELVRAQPSKHAAIKIKSIEPVATRPVRCIKVASEDELFLAGKFLLATLNTNGSHRAILTNRRYWRAATASRKGGRSLAVDIAMLDELREHTTSDAWDAIAPTTTVRPFSQIVCTSNAGDVRSEVLRSLRDPALKRITTGETAETKTGLFEWSVPMEVDPRDDRYWHMANPALGHLNDFSLADLRALFEAAQYRNLPGFQTESLCQWVDALEPGIMPAEHWAETLDPNSRRADSSPVYAALDVNYERSRSFIAIAARRADGNLHVEIVNAARGTDWVIPWLTGTDDAGVSRKKKFAGLAVQKTGAPVSGMMDDLKQAGIKVVEWGPGTEVAGGCSLLYDQITEHRIFHRPSASLDRAAASGVPRYVGEGWVFSRRDSPVDVSPLIACAAAAWLEHQHGVPPPQIHAWPSEETIKQWELDADEKFPAAELVVPGRSVLEDIEGTSWWTR